MTDDIMMEKISIQPPQVQFIVKQDVELLLFFCFCPRQINMADTIINKSLIYGTDLMYGFVKKDDSSGQSHSWELHIAWFKRNLFYHCRKKKIRNARMNVGRAILAGERLNCTRAFWDLKQNTVLHVCRSQSSSSKYAIFFLDDHPLNA